MKKLLSILCLITSCISYAQSNLPPCSGDYWNNCFGSYTYPEGDKFAGDKYVGEVRDNKFHGQGQYTYADGRQYVGQYKDGIKHGQGTFTFADGRKYVRQFKNNNYDGFGTFYNANGSILNKDYGEIMRSCKHKPYPQ